MILSGTLLFKNFSLFDGKIDGIWILLMNPTIWLRNDILLRHCVNQSIHKCWKRRVHYSMYFWWPHQHKRFWSFRWGTPGRQKKQRQQQRPVWIGLIVKRRRLSRVVVTCYSVFTIETFWSLTASLHQMIRVTLINMI